jgi:cytochrome b involved in lipid metabolism
MEQDGESDETNNDSVRMPPPPPTTTMRAAGPTSLDGTVSSSDRKMNDTTMPPPRYSAANRQNPSSGNKPTPAVNARAGGARFGLHDWKRLLAASKDLAQLKGGAPRRDIPPEEIRRHDKNHDGWIVVRGTVYNIGPYLPYHPGGIEIFKNVLGRDATTMFDKYHRWVNIDGLIGPLMIGTAASREGAASNSDRFSVVPPKESHLTNAPRVSVQQAASSSALFSGSHVDDDEEEEEVGDEALLPPAPT